MVVSEIGGVLGGGRDVVSCCRDGRGDLLRRGMTEWPENRALGGGMGGGRLQQLNRSLRSGLVRTGAVRGGCMYRKGLEMWVGWVTEGDNDGQASEFRTAKREN